MTNYLLSKRKGGHEFENKIYDHLLINCSYRLQDCVIKLKRQENSIANAFTAMLLHWEKKFTDVLNKEYRKPCSQ